MLVTILGILVYSKTSFAELIGKYFTNSEAFKAYSSLTGAMFITFYRTWLTPDILLFIQM